MKLLVVMFFSMLLISFKIDAQKELINLVGKVKVLEHQQKQLPYEYSNCFNFETFDKEENDKHVDLSNCFLLAYNEKLTYVQRILNGKIVCTYDVYYLGDSIICFVRPCLSFGREYDCSVHPLDHSFILNVNSRTYFMDYRNELNEGGIKPRLLYKLDKHLKIVNGIINYGSSENKVFYSSFQYKKEGVFQKESKLKITSNELDMLFFDFVYSEPYKIKPYKIENNTYLVDSAQIINSKPLFQFRAEFQRVLKK